MMNNSNSQGLLDSADKEKSQFSKGNPQKNNWQLLFLLSGVGFVVVLSNVWVTGVYTVLSQTLEISSKNPLYRPTPLDFTNEENMRKAFRIIAPLIAGICISFTNRRQTLIISCFVLLFSEFLINLGYKYNTTVPPLEKNVIFGSGCVLFTFGADMILVTLAVMVGKWFERSYATVAFGIVWVFCMFGGSIGQDYFTSQPSSNFRMILMLSLILCILIFIAATIISKIDQKVDQESIQPEARFRYSDFCQFRWNDALLIIGFSLAVYGQVFLVQMFEVLYNPLNSPIAINSKYYLPATKILLFTFIFLPIVGYLVDILGHKQYILMVNSALTIIALVFYQSISCTGVEILNDTDCNNESQFGFPMFLAHLTYFIDISVILPAFLLLGQRILFSLNIALSFSLSNLFFYVIDAPDNTSTLFVPLIISAVAIFFVAIWDLMKDKKLSPSQKYDIIDCSKLCICNKTCCE